MFLYLSCWGAILSEDSLLPLSRLYTGTLVHRLYQELKLTPSVENLFSLSPKMSQLYQVLLKTVESTVSPDFFQKMTKTTSCKKKKASNKKKKGTRCAIPETQHLCSVNRFAPLGVDDWKHYSWSNFSCHSDGKKKIWKYVTVLELQLFSHKFPIQSLPTTLALRNFLIYVFCN